MKTLELLNNAILGLILRLTLAAAAMLVVIVASSVPAHACEGARLESSRIELNALGQGLHAEGVTGSSRSVRIGFFRSRRTTQDMPGEIGIGVLDMSCGSRITGSQIRIDAVGTNIRARAGRVTVGGVVLR